MKQIPIHPNPACSSTSWSLLWRPRWVHPCADSMFKATQIRHGSKLRPQIGWWILIENMTHDQNLQFCRALPEISRWITTEPRTQNLLLQRSLLPFQGGDLSRKANIPSCWLRITLLNPMKQWTSFNIKHQAIQWYDVPTILCYSTNPIVYQHHSTNIIVPTPSDCCLRNLNAMVQNNFPKPQVAVSGHLTCCCKREFSAWLGFFVRGG